MRNIILNLMIWMFIYSCSNNDNNGVACSLFAPAVQQLFIELVDENGNNLLKNGTFNLEEISVRFDNIEFQVVEFGFFEDIIAITLRRQGDNVYEIILSEIETDILFLNLNLREEICGIEFLNLVTATYNGEGQTIITDNEYEPFIRVIR